MQRGDKNAGKLLYNKGLRCAVEAGAHLFAIKDVANRADFNIKSQGV